MSSRIDYCYKKQCFLFLYLGNRDTHKLHNLILYPRTNQDISRWTVHFHIIFGTICLDHLFHDFLVVGERLN